jgi:tRNA pseudouridine13 synthase
MDASFPRAHGASACSATIRTTPEDFFVEEIASFEPSGSGEHLLLTVEKRGMNTAWAAKRIAAWAGVAESAIGYAGLKDRHAVTRQRFSVWLPKKIAPEIAALQSDDLRVLEHAWHSRKLPRGALAGNRFELLLRDVVGERADIDARLETIRARGVPNAFGVQRFGREAGNLDKALAMFAGRRVKREERSLLLSAARSALFNDILARRVADGSWDRGLEGEVWMLAGSHSVFGPEPFDDALRARRGVRHPSHRRDVGRRRTAQHGRDPRTRGRRRRGIRRGPFRRGPRQGRPEAGAPRAAHRAPGPALGMAAGRLPAGRVFPDGGVLRHLRPA